MEGCNLSHIGRMHRLLVTIPVIIPCYNEAEATNTRYPKPLTPMASSSETAQQTSKPTKTGIGFSVKKFLLAQHTWLSSGKEYHALPATIRGSITRQQDGSERLIGWIQISILSLFALLYFAAPQPPNDAPFESVPILLGTHFVFTCFRLWLSYKTSLPLWFLVISIFMDIALLFGSIWSFHLEYGQPPAFYLKSPTLLYAFIFIGIRALRFEPGYVLLAGIVSSGGWFLLVLFAIFAHPDPGFPLTRDYVEYLTANRVLLGGEIDKIISIMLVTVVLTVAIARARKLLIRAIVEGSTAANLSHFVPEGIADRIKTAEGPLSEANTEQREATILFTDLASFTKMSEGLTPDQLIITVNEFFALASEAIQRNKGVIILFHGDAIMASYNLPSSDIDHASNAVATALELQKRLEAHTFSTGVQLKARIGINTGEVIGGFAGASGLLNYTLYGDNVNIAARLEELNKTHGTSILVSERTMQLSDQTRFQYTAKGNEVLRGRQAAINIFTPGWKE